VAFRRAIASLSKQDPSRQAITLTLEWFGAGRVPIKSVRKPTLESERAGDEHPIALERYGNRDNLGFDGRPACARFILIFMFFF
jgi:hypothetical protein